jgi:hypothetical protein
MILEQRYGAAQVVVRATSVLLQHADTIQTTSADEFRRDIFRVGWNFISERHAMAALVNMVSTVQWALDDVSDVRDMHRILPRVVADIRHQLNQRVLDTAAHSLAFLSNTQHIITYGYSTTVQYALQHALRNGHRVHVTCVNTPMAYEVNALAERIAAIGISVAVEDMHTHSTCMDLPTNAGQPRWLIMRLHRVYPSIPCVRVKNCSPMTFFLVISSSGHSMTWHTKHPTYSHQKTTLRHSNALPVSSLIVVHSRALQSMPG